MYRFNWLLSVVLVTTLSASGCLSPGKTEVAPQQLQSAIPLGMNVDPNDPTKGWVTSGGQTIYFKLTNSGWAPDDTRQPPTPTSVTTNSPQPYLPMMNFLRDYGLNVEDIDVVTRAYNLMGARRDQAENTKAFLNGLNQSLTGPVPLDQAVNRAQTLKQVNSLIE